MRDGRLSSLDEPQSSQTCVTVLADDDVVGHGDAEYPESQIGIAAILRDGRFAASSG
jgi:hypothetical protein